MNHIHYFFLLIATCSTFSALSMQNQRYDMQDYRYDFSKVQVNDRITGKTYLLSGHKKDIIAMLAIKGSPYIVSSARDNEVIIWDLRNKATDIISRFWQFLDYCGASCYQHIIPKHKIQLNVAISDLSITKNEYIVGIEKGTKRQIMVCKAPTRNMSGG